MPRRETVQEPLSYCTVLCQSLPHQEHKTSKRMKRAGEEKEGQQEGWKWKELSSKTLGTRTPTKVCMAGKQPCKTENEHGKYFLWPLKTQGRQRGMTNCGISWHQTREKQEVMSITQRQPRKHKTFDGREAEQRPMKTFHYSLSNTNMLSVGWWVTSGWGWRTK